MTATLYRRLVDLPPGLLAACPNARTTDDAIAATGRDPQTIAADIRLAAMARGQRAFVAILSGPQSHWLGAEPAGKQAARIVRHLERAAEVFVEANGVFGTFDCRAEDARGAMQQADVVISTDLFNVNWIEGEPDEDDAWEIVAVLPVEKYGRTIHELGTLAAEDLLRPDVSLEEHVVRGVERGVLA